MSRMSETNYCARHGDTETNLRCSRCDELICPKCLVQAAVGVRCPDCAKSQRVPTFDVTGAYLARAIAAGLVLGIGGGAAGVLITLLVVALTGITFVGPLVIVGIGYLTAEGISAAVNRKRGRRLKYVAAGSVAIAVLIIATFSFVPFALLAGGYAVYVAVKRF